MKYRVTLVQTITESAIVEVEANNEDEAEAAAIKLAIEDDLCWNFADAAGDYQASFIYEIEDEKA